MAEKSEQARLNIYVSRQLWRRVKLAAAAADLSVSQFCTNAIEARLTAADAVGSGDSERNGEDPQNAVARARKFKASHFGKSTFRVSTAELLRAFRAENGER